MAIDAEPYTTNGFKLSTHVRDAIQKADWIEESDAGMVALAMKAAYAIENLEDLGDYLKAVYAVPHLNACLVQLGLSPVARKALGTRAADPENPLTRMQNDRDHDSTAGG